MKALSLALVLSLSACAAPRPAEPPVTVEGRVAFRGNEPFAAAWLETDMQTYYVLVMDEATGATLLTPARYRVTGRVYRDEWNGMPLAHLDVESMRRIDG
jgi:hypothetical protein